METLKQNEILPKDDFSDPKFYKGIFEHYLKDQELSGRQWLTGVSLLMQTMRSEIGGRFNSPEYVSEIDSFVKFSLSEQFKKHEISSNDIERSRDFVEQVVDVLDEL